MSMQVGKIIDFDSSNNLGTTAQNTKEGFMPLFELVLTEFLFPEDLPNRNANFRFIVDLRFINEKGQFITEHAVMPSLDTFWECDTGRKDRPNYVRHEDNCTIGDIVYSQFNMDNDVIDDWDKLILCVKGESIHSIQFKVIDVDRKDAWDKVKNFLEGMIGAIIGKIKGGIPGKLPFPLPESLGGAADDLQSFLLKKLAGGDKVLFRGSGKLEIPENGQTTPFEVEGKGTEGKYKIVGCLKKTEEDSIDSQEEGREQNG